MNTLADIPKLERLSREFGNRMIDVSFPNGGVRFTYRVGEGELVKEYPDRYDGIKKEIERFELLKKLET